MNDFFLCSFVWFSLKFWFVHTLRCWWGGCKPFENIERNFEKWTEWWSRRRRLTWLGYGWLCGFTIGGSSNSCNFLNKIEKNKIRREKNNNNGEKSKIKEKKTKFQNWKCKANVWNQNTHYYQFRKLKRKRKNGKSEVRKINR